MNALRELENKILEELQDVHDIQRKLVESRLQRGDHYKENSKVWSGDYNSDNQYLKPRGYEGFNQPVSSNNTPKKSKTGQRSTFFHSPWNFPADEVKENFSPNAGYGNDLRAGNSKKKLNKLHQPANDKFEPTFYVFGPAGLDEEPKFQVNRQRQTSIQNYVSPTDLMRTPSKQSGKSHFRLEHVTPKRLSMERKQVSDPTLLQQTPKTSSALKGEKRRWSMAEFEDKSAEKQRTAVFGGKNFAPTENPHKSQRSFVTSSSFTAKSQMASQKHPAVWFADSQPPVSKNKSTSRLGTSMAVPSHASLLSPIPSQLGLAPSRSNMTWMDHSKPALSQEPTAASKRSHSIASEKKSLEGPRSKREASNPDCSFRPRLSAKSMRMAQNLPESSFTRLTKVVDKVRVTTEERELSKCTFTPDINQKSAEMDHTKHPGGRREDRLFGIAEEGKKKIEKLRVSEYIKQEVEFRNECSFVPKTLGKQLVNNQPVLERFENWQKKRETKMCHLAQELRGKEEIPTFKPKIEMLNREIIDHIPQELIKDQYMLEGVASYLRRQQKAKQKLQADREIQKKHMVLREFLYN